MQGVHGLILGKTTVKCRQMSLLISLIILGVATENQSV